MTIKWKSKIILFKMESTYGVDPTPTGADDALLMTNVTFAPMEGDDKSRELERPWLGAQPMIPTGLRARLQGRVELAPSGTAGTAPQWGKMLRACAMAETVTASTSVAYNPISDNMESATIWFQMGGTLHKLKGSRGTAKFQLSAQDIPYIEFDFVGLWVEPVEASRPTVDLSAWENPQIVTDTNTPVFSINGVDLVLREATLDMANQVDPRLLVGSESIIIPDRADAFSARVEAVPVSTFNPYALAIAQSEVPVLLTHGTGAGRIAAFSLPRCQLKRPNGFENAQNILEWPLELVPLPGSGNDQWTLTLT